jgi:hypothetical protein
MWNSLEVLIHGEETDMVQAVKFCGPDVQGNQCAASVDNVALDFHAPYSTQPSWCSAQTRGI